MKRTVTRTVFLIASSLTLAGQPAANTARIGLEKNWLIQSSAKVTERGDAISTPAFQPKDWYAATIPSTVVRALVDNKIYPDPTFGMNLRSIPGTSYRIGQNFANLAMPGDSPFRVSWWYRTEFKLPATVKGKRLWLNFDSINYRANIWLNGREVAGSDKVAGMYRTFEFDVTDIAKIGTANVVAVEVFPPKENDLTITFVDWNPTPPDKDMGLVKDVYILTSGPVALRNPQVITRLDKPPDKAHLTVSADLTNATGRPVEGTLRAMIGEVAISKKVRLAANESAHVILAPEEHPQLNIAHPKLWWPYPLGPQNLERLRLEFLTGGAVSDHKELRFGIREVTSELDTKEHRLFKINGKNILIRGGGWGQDMLLRWQPEREENEIRYARDMNLNTIRLEGKMMNDSFYEVCDRLGVLVMPGWCCCSHWEQWKKWKPEDYTIAGDSLTDQLRLLRNHPSVFVWLLCGSMEATSRRRRKPSRCI